MRSGSRLEAGAAGAAVRGGGAAAGSSLLREAEDGQICGLLLFVTLPAFGELGAGSGGKS